MATTAIVPNNPHGMIQDITAGISKRQNAAIPKITDITLIPHPTTRQSFFVLKSKNARTLPTGVFLESRHILFQVELFHFPIVPHDNIPVLLHKLLQNKIDSPFA